MTDRKPIIWKEYEMGGEVWCEGWGLKGEPGIVNDYAGAIALNMGLWDEYCKYHRDNTDDAVFDKIFRKRKR